MLLRVLGVILSSHPFIDGEVTPTIYMCDIELLFSLEDNGDALFVMYHFF